MMNRLITVWIILLVFVSFQSMGQKKDTDYFLEKDNIKHPEMGNILPMQMFNFHVKPYEALGTINLVDSLAYKGKRFAIYSFGITKAVDQKEYYSFFNVVIQLENGESLMELAKANKIFAANVSRNHPYYFGQGTLIRNDYRVNFVAFTQPNNDIAIINTKIYQLSQGRTILLRQDDEHQFILKDHQFSDKEMHATKDLKGHISVLLDKMDKDTSTM